jgi:hypothetical protein
MTRVGQVVARLRAEHPWWVFVAFALCVAIGTEYFFTVKVEKYHHSTIRISGDGRYYYAYVTSLALDGDVDFANQYANPKQGNPWGHGKTPTGKMANPFYVGAAIMWMPFFGVAHGASLVAEPHALAADGYSDLTQEGTLYGSFVYGVLAAVLCYAMARRRDGPGAALAGAFVALVCGPVLQYLVHQPSFSHAPSAFAVTLLIFLWDRGRGERPGDRTMRSWLGAGAAIGLAMLVRPQNLLYALPIVVEGVRALVRAWREGRKPALARAAARPAAGAGVALLVFLPQIIIWHSLYGYWLGVPQGASYMQWGEPMLLDVLFSARNGLFVYAPMWLVGIVGLGWLARREPWTAWPLFACFWLAAWVNGAVTDWWGIGSIGARRFDGLVPIVALGFSAAARAGLDLIERQPRRAGGVALALCLLFFYRCNFSIDDQFTRFDRLGEPDSRSSLEVYLGVLQREGHKLWRGGNPIELPAALAFHWRTGASLERYDEIVGPNLLQGDVLSVDQGSHRDQERGALAFGSDKHARFCFRGFGGTEPLADGKTPGRVAIGPSARILAPLNTDGAIGVRLTGVAKVDGALAVIWNGDKVAEGSLVVGQPIDLRFTVSDAIANRGVNVIDLDVAGAPEGQPVAVYGRMELVNPPDK